tara:strand:+ start:6076 stop:6756 length:681 start_codon:yes stop_codon:yes gene_type:complete
MKEPSSSSAYPKWLSNYLANVAERNRQQAINQSGADPLSPLTQLDKGSRALFDMLSDFSGAKEIAQNPTSPLGWLTAMLGPAGMLRSQVTKGALKFLPTNPFGKEKSIAGDAISEAAKLTGKALKKTAPVAAAGLTALPAEAEGGIGLVLKLAGMINTRAPTVLRHVSQRIGQAPNKDVSQQLDDLMRRLNKQPITPKQREQIYNLYNSGKYDNETLEAAVKEAVK